MKESEELLKKQIVDLFDNYDDEFATEGWAELRKKFPAKEKKRLAIWWLSAAAACLILTASLYFSTQTPTEINSKSKTLVKNEVIEQEKNKPAALKKSVDTASNIELKINNFNEKSTAEYVQKTIINSSLDHGIANVKTGPVIENKGTVDKNNIAIDFKKTDVDNNLVSNPKQDANQNQFMANVNAEEKKKDTIATKLSTEEFLKNESKLLANTASPKSKSANAASLEVFTGTFFNYHENQNAQLSAALGLNANLKMGKNIVLSLGAGLSQNKVNYKHDIPTQVASAMVVDKTSQNTPNKTASLSSTAINGVNFDARLLSIDLPIAIKVYPSKKQNFYFSTGINSSSYLSQKYVYDYNSSNFTINSGESQSLRSTEETSLSGFDFASTAIIAVGINQNIGKHTLIFEPYYKPALNSMGNKNLKVSSAGLNLKFNFNNKKN